MKLSLVLSENYSNSQFALIGEDYENLEWLDAAPKPTKVNLESQWLEVEAKIANRASNRESALAKLAALGLTEAEIAAL